MKAPKSGPGACSEPPSIVECGLAGLIDRHTNLGNIREKPEVCPDSGQSGVQNLDSAGCSFSNSSFEFF